MIYIDHLDVRLIPKIRCAGCKQKKPRRETLTEALRDLALPAGITPLRDLVIRGRWTEVDVTAHVEVVVVDVQHLLAVFVDQSVRERPADDLTLRVVSGALVVCMMELGWANQRNHARRVNVIGNLFLDEGDAVALCLMQEGDAALSWTVSFQCPPNFIITGWVERDGWST